MKDSQKKAPVPASDRKEEAEEGQIVITEPSLPKGGGSFLGLSTDFKIDVQKGSAAFQIPITVPSGRGREDKLILSYHSAGGNGVFGQGFSLNLPVIKRKTDCGIPVYRDMEDRFTTVEYGDLIAADTKECAQGRQIRTFVPAVEKEFALIEQIKEREGVSFRITAKDGTRSWFGTGKNSRVSDPTQPERVFQWMLSDIEDVKGNKTIYEYEESGAAREIRKIFYSNYQDEAGEERYAYEVEFHYTKERTDPFSSYRSGFCLETEKLCEKAVIYRNIPERAPIREYHFDYGTDNGISLLSKITIKGAVKKADGAFQWEELPPLTFTYSGSAQGGPEYKSLHTGSRPLPGELSKGFYQFVDLYGEGISGILYHDDRAAMYYEPMGEGVYGEPGILKEFPMEGTRGEPFYRLVSLKGDGTYDMVVTLPGRQGVYEQKDGGFSPFREFSQGLNLYGKDYVELTDVQGDHLSHAVIAEEDAITYYPSLKTEGFDAPVTTGAPKGFPPKNSAQRQRVVSFLDLIGDGLKHRVLVENGKVEYYPNLGHGHFGERITLEHAPVFHGSFDAERLYFADLDGSGTTDFIYVYPTYVEVFPNCCGKYFLDGMKIPLPEHFSNRDSIHFADIAGMGYQSMIFTKMGDTVRHYWCDLHGEKKPYLLERIDNHMGEVKRIGYESSALLYLKDKEQGVNWNSRIPFPVLVVRSLHTEDRVSGRITESEYHYRDPYYDAEKRKFRGFAYVECVQKESYPHTPAASCSKKTKTWYHNGSSLLPASSEYYGKGTEHRPGNTLPEDGGLPDAVCHALEGKVIREELYEPDGTDREGDAVTVLHNAYYVTCGEKGSCFAGLRESLAYDYERTPVDPRITHTAILKTDEFENITAEAKVYYKRRMGAVKGQKHTEIDLTLTSYINRTEGTRLLGIENEKRKLQITCPEAFLPFEALAEKMENAIQPGGFAENVRLFAYEKNYYWNEEQTEALAPGNVSSVPLLHHKRQAVLTESGLEAVYGAPPDRAAWEKGYGYLSEDGFVWNRGVVHSFYGKDRFYTLKKEENSFVTETDPLFTRVEWEYDAYNLLPVRSKEYVESGCTNEVDAEIDYSNLKYSRITDRNRNVTRAEYDPNGNLCSIWYPEKEVNPEETGSVNSSFAKRNIENESVPAVTYRYDFFAYENRGAPVSCMERTSEYPDGKGKLRCRILYFDGAGNQIETRIRHGDRWDVCERKLVNGSGQDVLSYLPYETEEEFTGFADLEAAGAGRPIHSHYDARGRMTRTDAPKAVLPGGGETAYLHTRIEYFPWNELHYDHLATLADSEYGKAVSSLAGEDAEIKTVKEVLQKSGRIGGAPVRKEKDVYGNICLEVLSEKSGEKEMEMAAFYETDIQGRRIMACDPRLREQGSFNIRFTYDFQGNILKSESADAGTVLRIFDCRGKIRREQDGNGNKKRLEYDRLGRLTQKQVEGIGTVERIEYGERITDGEACNLRGNIYRHFDEAGVEISYAYDRFDRVTRRSRRFFKAKEHVNIGEEEADLEDEAWEERFAHNLFGGEALHITPDGTMYVTEYNERGMQESVRSVSDGIRETYIREKLYDASGLPKAIRYGNGAVTSYEFSKGSKELYRLCSEKEDGSPLLELRYYYDEMGNLSRLTNRCIAVGNRTGVAAEEPEDPRVFDYTYDRYGRLLSSTGWESAGNGRITKPEELIPFTERYRYDRGNNLTETEHLANGRSHTERTEIREGSNRLFGAEGKEIPYDANGNQIRTADGKPVRWNWNNKLTGCGGTDREEEQEIFIYDYKGDRVRKIRTIRREDGGTEITEKRYMGNYEFKTVKRIQNGEEKLLVCRDSVNIRSGSSLLAISYQDRFSRERTRRFLPENHNASVCMELDEAGDAVTYEEYVSFGRTAFTAGAREELNEKEYRFGGKEKDACGLYYFGTRYYGQFRFLSCDSLEFLRFSEWRSLNLYAYCRNNPEKYTDDMGENPGQLFDTADAAALNFAIEFNELSIKGNQEIGAYVYSVFIDGRTQYAYDTPFTDRSKDSVDPGRIARERVPGITVGLLHTHGAFARGYDNENFSPEDINYAYYLTGQYGRNVPIYVATPGGKLKKHDPATATTTRIPSKRIPHDPAAILHFHDSCSLCVSR